MPLLRPQYALPSGKLAREDGCISHRIPEEPLIIESKHAGPGHKGGPKHAGQPAPEPEPQPQPAPEQK